LLIRRIGVAPPVGAVPPSQTNVYAGFLRILAVPQPSHSRPDSGKTRLNLKKAVGTTKYAKHTKEERKRVLRIGAHQMGE